MSDTTLIERPATASQTPSSPNAVQAAQAAARAATLTAATTARAAGKSAATRPAAGRTSPAPAGIPAAGKPAPVAAGMSATDKPAPIAAVRPAAGNTAPAGARTAAVAPATRTVLSFERTAAGSAQLRDPGVVLSPNATRLLMLFEEPQTIDGLRSMIDEAWLPEALIELERRKLVRRFTVVCPVEAVPAQPAPEAAIPVVRTRVEEAPAGSTRTAAAHGAAGHGTADSIAAKRTSATAAPHGAAGHDMASGIATRHTTADRARADHTPTVRTAGTRTAGAHTTRPHAGETRPIDPAKEAAVRLARQRAQARILFLQQIGRLSTLMIDRIESCQSEAELQRLTPAFADLLPAETTRQARAA